MNLRIASVLIFGLMHSAYSACPKTDFCVGQADNSRCEFSPDFGVNNDAGGYPFGCTYATAAFLGQPPFQGSDPLLANDLFKYGKYCGLNNRCSEYETEA